MRDSYIRASVLLPLLLASALLPATFVTIAAGEVPGDARITAPTINGNILTTIEIRVEDLDPLPEDMDGFNLVGRVDPRVLRIQAVQNGAALNEECAAMGGADLFRAVANPATGEFSASELCLAGLPHPDDSGFVGSGVLVAIQVQIVAEACTAIDLDSANSFLRDVDGFTSTAIPASVSDGSFCSASQFDTDFSGQAANVGHRKVDLGDFVTFHANIKSTGNVWAYIQFRVDRPDGQVDFIIGGPVLLQSGNENNMHIDYTPPKVGFYQVSATPFWSENGGVNFSFKASTEFRNLDFLVR